MAKRKDRNADNDGPAWGPDWLHCPECHVELQVMITQSHVALVTATGAYGNGIALNEPLSMSADEKMIFCPRCKNVVLQLMREAEGHQADPADGAAAEHDAQMNQAFEQGQASDLAVAEEAQDAQAAAVPETATNETSEVTSEQPETAQPATAEASATDTAADTKVEQEAIDGRPFEDSEPRDQRLPFPRPPFDLEAAMMQIEAKERSATSAWSAYESANERAKSLKKSAEQEDVELHDLIREMRERREDAQSAGGMLRLVGAVTQNGTIDPNAEAKKPGCAYERETGRPCPICRAAKPGDENLDRPENPLHPDHEEVAKRRAEDEALQGELCQVNVFLDVYEIGELTREDFDELRAWASALHIQQTTDSSVLVPVRPKLLEQACEAAEPGEERQSCRKCGTMLIDAGDLKVEPSEHSGAVHVVDGHVAWYPVGALVGIECDGEQEEARPTAKRGTRNKRQRHNPDAIAAEQRRADPIEVAEEPAASAAEPAPLTDAAML